ncbi:MAG: hypothetical protein ACYCS1_00710 [Gammaproteobacteria bacterium]
MRSLLRACDRNRATRREALGLLAAGAMTAQFLIAPAQATHHHTQTPDTTSAPASSSLTRFLKTERVPWLHLIKLGATRTGAPLSALIIGHSAHPQQTTNRSRLVVLLSPALDHSGHAVRIFAVQLIRQWLKMPAPVRHHLMQRLLLVFFLGRGYRPMTLASDAFHWPTDLPKPSSTHSQNLLLAETPTTRAWLTLFARWHPALVTEMITRHSAAWRDNFLFGGTPVALLAPKLARLTTRLVTDVRTIWRHSHIAVGTWMQPRNPEDPDSGVQTISASPTHILGYSALADVLAVQWICNGHTAIRQQIRQIAQMGSGWISVLTREATPLLRAEHQLATEAQDHYATFRKGFSIHEVLKRSLDRFLLRTYAYSETLSPISGTVWIRYDWNKPRNYLVPRYGRLAGRDSLPDIAGFVIPAGFPRAVQTLRIHGIQTDEITSSMTLKIRTDRLSHIRWKRSKHNPLPVIASFDTTPEIREFVYPPGSVFIPINQPLARLIVLLLDAQSPLSLFRLGYFRAMFSPLHIHPQSALETLARTLLRKHPRLARRFVDRIMHPAFAESPTARLDFFYRYVFQDPVSPGLYPIGTLRHAPLALLQTP